MATTLTLSEAVTALQQGGVIAYPTEAVWGLGCDPRQETAVHTLLNIKQRASGERIDPGHGRTQYTARLARSGHAITRTPA